ncbi:MAG: hypothetical protein QOF59_2886 [Actinomycetota bacterium]|nr:hypothetical protein [Actinomycetota bacterium]
MHAGIAALAVVAGSLVVVGNTRAQAAPVHSAQVTLQSTSVSALAAPIVGIAATPTGHGYWRVGADGGVLTAGDAHFYGSAAGRPHDRIVAIAATRSGHGYWLTDRQGAVFSFGDAAYHGSMAGHHLNLPITGMAATPNGNGYWLVASDGGIFSFNARFHGSTGGMRLNQPITGMAATPNGQGYWLVASDGGIFSFNAHFYGSMGGTPLNLPITGMAAAPNGNGYTLVAADGGLFRFGSNSPFYGSAVNACPGAAAVAVAMSPGARGYWIAFADARTYAFSPVTRAPKCDPSTSSRSGLMAADLLRRINDERSIRHLAPMTWDPNLANYASVWSADMASHGFRHSSIGNLLGTYNYVGENIAAGSAGTLEGSLHDAWMHSDGHRANILAPGFTRVGVGVFCTSNGSIYLTQDFGHPSSAGSPQTSSTTPPVDPIARPDSGSLHC